MLPLDVLASPWAILPEKLKVITEIYDRHSRGEKVDLEAIEAQIGRPLNNQRRLLDVQDGVALISINGPIAKRLNFFTRISGGVSTELVAKDIRAAVEDPEIHSIVLSIDSPGGTVDGTEELANLVFAARQRKPVIAFGDGSMFSAAYWIASAGTRVLLSGGTAGAGSIGVVAQHVDYSEAERKQGIQVTEITAGKYKRIASSHAPLTDEGRATIQDQVDHLYSIFVDTVARHRGVSADDVLERMADGRIFIGQRAIDAGLVDGFADKTELVPMLNEEHSRRVKSKKGLYPMKKIEMTEEEKDAIEQSAFGRGKAEAEKKASEDAAAAKAESDKRVDAARVEGATAERERIKAVETQSMKGHEALIDQLKFDGKTTGPEAAVQVLAAEKAKCAGRATQIKKDLPDPAGFVEAREDKDPSDAKEPDVNVVVEKARQYQAEQKKLGKEISTETAVAHVRKEMGAPAKTTRA